MYNDSFNFFSSMPEEARIFFTVYFAVIAIVMLCVLVPYYIMLSIAYTKIAKRRSIKGAWLAWIPVARYWIIGGLADSYDKHSSGHDRRFRVILLIAAIVYYLAFAVFCIGIAGFIPLIDNAYYGSEFEIFASAMQVFLGVEFGVMGMAFTGIALTAVYYICIYKLFESLNPKFSLLFFMLSLFVGYFMPICLLVLKNKGYPYPEEESPAIPEAVRIGWYDV